MYWSLGKPLEQRRDTLGTPNYSKYPKYSAQKWRQCVDGQEHVLCASGLCRNIGGHPVLSPFRHPVLASGWVSHECRPVQLKRWKQLSQYSRFQDKSMEVVSWNKHTNVTQTDSLERREIGRMWTPGSWACWNATHCKGTHLGFMSGRGSFNPCFSRRGLKLVCNVTTCYNQHQPTKSNQVP